MVFRTVSEPEPSATSLSMASIVSAKSQPLHNFSLTDLRWSPANHRLRRQSADSAHLSPLRDFAPRSAEHDSGDCGHQAPNDMPLVSAGDIIDAPDEKEKGDPGAASGRSSKILLRLRTKEKSSDSPPEAEAPVAQGKAPANIAEPKEVTSKVWNLRPRKPITKTSSPSPITGGALRNGGSLGPEIRSLEGSGRAEAARLRSAAEAEKGEAHQGNVKFSIPLTKEEIKADFLAFTGSRPVRRPKKRPRTVQRALDFCFPGLWLASITPDSYKVVENPPKG